MTITLPNLMTAATVDAALAFYDLDARYRAPALNCLQVISAAPALKQKFAAVYDVLYVQNTEAFRALWQCQDVNTLFGAGVNPFVTNLMILLGAPVHQANLQKLGLDAATPYVCHSWLLSPDLTPLLKADANIRKFQALFAITPGADCVGDLLNHVYNIKDCADYHQLPTRTSLQTNIKRALLDGQPFRLGLGTLKRSH